MGSAARKLSSTFSNLAEGIRARGDKNLKLEVQKIKDISGGYGEWAEWNSREECAFSGSVYEISESLLLTLQVCIFHFPR